MLKAVRLYDNSGQKSGGDFLVDQTLFEILDQNREDLRSGCGGEINENDLPVVLVNRMVIDIDDWRFKKQIRIFFVNRAQMLQRGTVQRNDEVIRKFGAAECEVVRRKLSAFWLKKYVHPVWFDFV